MATHDCRPKCVCAGLPAAYRLKANLILCGLQRYIRAEPFPFFVKA